MKTFILLFFLFLCSLSNLWSQQNLPNPASSFPNLKNGSLIPEKELTPPNQNLKIQGDNYLLKESKHDTWDGATWINITWDVYFHNSNNQQIADTTKFWNGTNWKDSLLYTNDYDAMGHVTLYQYQHWLNSVLINDSRYSYIYDSNGRLQNDLDQNGDSLSWVDNYRSIYSYNSSGYTDSILTQKWNGSSWDKSYIYYYTYFPNDSLMENIFKTWNGTGWDNNYKTIYSYDSASYPYEFVLQGWDGSNWVNNSKYSYNYDLNGSYLGYTSQMWDGTTWINNYRYVYSYDSNGNRTENNQQTWDDTVWVNGYRNVYEYNVDGKQTMDTYQQWNGSAWDGVFRILYDYDSFGNSIVNTSQTWDGTLWVNSWRTTYTYEVISDVNDNSVQPNKFELSNNYPNPFNPSTTIKYSIPERSFVSLKVYDILGREVSNLIAKVTDSGNYNVTFDADNSANGTGLTSGVYFYTLYSKSIEGNKENRVTKKMILLR